MSYPPMPGPDGSGAPGDDQRGAGNYGGTPGYPNPGTGMPPGYGPVEGYWGANPASAVPPPPDQSLNGYTYPGYQAPGYPMASPYGSPYQYPGQFQQFRPTEGMAIASLVISCVGVAGLCAWGIGGALLGSLGAVFGHVAKRRIRNTGAGGGGMALAGIIVGWVAAGLGLAILAVIVVAIVMDANSTTTT